jgi:hypothetical protein
MKAPNYHSVTFTLYGVELVLLRSLSLCDSVHSVKIYWQFE